MNQWPFVMAAYSVALLGTAALLGWSFVWMRSAESKAASLREQS